MARPALKIFLLFTALLLSAGCTLGASQSAVKLDGGIWRSSDSGSVFAQINDVLATRGQALTMNNVDINSLAFDPQQPATIYAASQVNGLFYTTDGGASWQQFNDLKSGKISSIAVGFHDKCVIFASMANKLYKTENCGRDWINIYFHQKSQVALTALALDPKSTSTLYLGTSEGEVLKSIDGGNTWQTSYRISGDIIADLIIDPYESQIIYAGASNKGIFKSSDSGASWNSLTAGLKQFSGSSQYKKLIYDPATVNSLIYISKFGMLRTVDGGNSWTAITLLSADKAVSILAVAVNPKDSKEIYYATASSLVKTVDAGVKWSSKQLPYSRLTTDIKINPLKPNMVYLATRQIAN